VNRAAIAARATEGGKIHVCSGAFNRIRIFTVRDALRGLDVTWIAKRAPLECLRLARRKRRDEVRVSSGELAMTARIKYRR
jgi:chloramphenicol 3-O-phosphotransferase